MNADKRDLGLDELFDRAVEMTPREQGEFLARHCSGRPALLAQLEALLDLDRQLVGRQLVGAPIESAPVPHEPSQFGPIATPPTGSMAAPLPPGPAVPDAIAPGVKIGSYTVVEELDKGGMAHVYLARHDELGTRVVVKVLDRALSHNPDMVRRFKREARAAARIDHPGIVDVFDVGEHVSGDLYIVMEYLVGENLKQQLAREGQLDEGVAIEFLRQAASALQAAHEQGVIHRDLKPANLFVVPDPGVRGGERLQVLDFGIAKLLGTPAELETQTGMLMGTPAYMSPEQCRGARNVDHRTDLYALGVILFQMLCGRRPFECEGHGEYVIAHNSEPPPPVRQLEPAASAGVAAVVARLLAKDPDQRFASARELEDALASVAAGDESELEAVVAVSETVILEETPDTVNMKAVPFRRPRLARRWVVAAVASLVMLAGGGLAVESALEGPADLPLEVDRATVEAIALVGATHTEARRVLYAALEREPPLAVASLRALRALKLPDAAGRIRPRLADYTGAIRAELAMTLADLDDLDAVGALEQVLTGDDRRIALAAAVTLARAGHDRDRVREVLADGLSSAPHGGERWRRAATGLATLGDAAALTALAGELAHRDPMRVVSAAEILARQREAPDAPKAMAVLRRVCRDTPEERRDAKHARRQASLALAKLGDPAALAFVPHGLASTEPDDRRYAVAVAARLARRGGAEFEDRIEALTADDHREVGLAARVAMTAMRLAMGDK